MAQGNLNHTRIVNKAKHFHSHGKHRPILGWLASQRRDQEQSVRQKPEMFDSVREAFDRGRRG